MHRRHVTSLSFVLFFLASCTAWQDGSGCRTGDEGDEGGEEPEPADTCKPGDQTCHGGAPAPAPDDAPPKAAPK